MKKNLVVIHFGEIWLKGRNRGFFIKKLYHNIKTTLRNEDYDKLENARDRFVLHLNKKSDIGSITKKLGRTFGISWFAPAIITSNKISEIISTCAKFYKKDELVRVEVKRSYKGLKYNSQELVSSFLKNKKKFPFILDRESEKELRINLTKDGAVITQEKMKGPGGLPVGSSGKCIVLISGGIDSPVASIFAMKRGLAPIYLHVHAFPKNDSAQKSKMKEEISLLKEYYVNSKSYFIPSYLFQAATLKTPKEYELVLFKKFLYKLAEKVGGEEKADVIVTGESLGQVASQTVKNLIASEKDISLLVVRPLITFDKQEIINEAKRLGTYEISIKKYPDVCSFRAENPSTGAKEEFINKLYKQCKLDNIVKNSIKKASVS